MTGGANSRPRCQPIPSACVIDLLNDGDKQVTSHHDAFALARQQEEAARKQQEESVNGPTPASTAPESPQSLPDPTSMASKCSSAQASISSVDSGDPKHMLHLTNVYILNLIF